MTGKHDAKILERLRRLEALCSSPNASEAASAKRILQKLLAEHGLHAVPEDLPPLVRALSPLHRWAGASKGHWSLRLAQFVADRNGCALVLEHEGRGRGLFWCPYLVGEQTDIDAATDDYDELYDKLERYPGDAAAKAYVLGRRDELYETMKAVDPTAVMSARAKRWKRAKESVQ